EAPMVSLSLSAPAVGRRRSYLSRMRTGAFAEPADRQPVKKTAAPVELTRPWDVNAGGRSAPPGAAAFARGAFGGGPGFFLVRLERGKQALRRRTKLQHPEHVPQHPVHARPAQAVAAFHLQPPSRNDHSTSDTRQSGRRQTTTARRWVLCASRVHSPPVRGYARSREWRRSSPRARLRWPSRRARPKPS